MNATAHSQATDDEVFPGSPRNNTVDAGEKLWQTPVYATKAEARISGSGWLYWIGQVDTLAWVRARMAEADHGSIGARDDMVLAVAESTGMVHASGLPLASARDLCEAAGWPS